MYSYVKRRVQLLRAQARIYILNFCKVVNITNNYSNFCLSLSCSVFKVVNIDCVTSQACKQKDVLREILKVSAFPFTKILKIHFKVQLHSYVFSLSKVFAANIHVMLDYLAFWIGLNAHS